MANAYESAAIVTGALSLAPLAVALTRDYKEQHGLMDASGSTTEIFYTASLTLLALTLILAAAGRRARA